MAIKMNSGTLIPLGGKREAEGFPQAQVTEDEIRMVTESVVKTASVRAAGTLCPRCKKGKFVDGVCTNCRGSKLPDRPLPKIDSSEEMETVEPMSGRAGAVVKVAGFGD